MSHHVVKQVVAFHFDNCFEFFLAVEFGSFDVFVDHFVLFTLAVGRGLFELKFFVKVFDWGFDLVFKVVERVIDVGPKLLAEDWFVVKGVTDYVFDLLF